MNGFACFGFLSGSSGGGGGGGDQIHTGVAELDFGAITENNFTASITIANTNITASSVILATIAPYETSDHSFDEILLEEINLIPSNLDAGVGFEIQAYCSTSTYGKFKVNYAIKY
jgi:hypothetical protein